MRQPHHENRSSRLALSVAGLATALTMSLGGAATASATAQADDPIPEFDFSDCPPLPDNASRSGSVCFNAIVTSGRFTLGDLSDDIKEPIHLTYASFRETEPPHKNFTVFGALRSEEFKARDGIFKDPITEVWAKMVYAGKFETPSSADFEINLDAKVRLTRPFLLGPHCEIGKENKPHPLELRLTTGTTNPPPPNQPISGEPAKIVAVDPVKTRKAVHVDNAFAVPGARGCFLDTGLVNHIVNSQAGLPSPAGHNEIILNEYIGQKNYTDLP